MKVFMFYIFVYMITNHVYSFHTLDQQIQAANDEVEKYEGILQGRVDEYNRLLGLKSQGRKEPDASYRPISCAQNQEKPVKKMIDESIENKVNDLEKRILALEENRQDSINNAKKNEKEEKTVPVKNEDTSSKQE